MYIKMFDYFGDYSSQKQTMKIMRNIVDSFKANDDLVSEYLKIALIWHSPTTRFTLWWTDKI